MKNFKIFQDFLKHFCLNFLKIFQIKHPINNHPRGGCGLCYPICTFDHEDASFFSTKGFLQ
jgi:hypothetical protein